MKKNSQLTRVVLYQNLGFMGILVICFLDEAFKLPSLIFANLPFSVVHRQFAIQMLLVLAVWFLVSASTRRILERVHYLEKFMRVCSWCRQIHYNGQWMPLEEFMRHGFDTPTTHGICKECLRQQQEAFTRGKEARRKTESPG